MRITVVSFFSLIFAVLLAHADEKLAVLKVGSEVYSNVTVTSVTSTDIYFTHDKGIGNTKLKNLDPALQKHFNYDAAKASATEQKQKASQAQYAAAGADGTGGPVTAANAKTVMQAAITKVKAIVNQPVTPLNRTPDMQVSIYQPGWFHDGAIKPDFNTVDIRATQGLDYGKHVYVSSDANPGAAFRGSELEFNSMTKYFYTDRSLPKAKLSEAEMVEINRLYRVIGKCEQILGEGGSAEPMVGGVSVPSFLQQHKKALVGGAAFALVLLLAMQFLRRRES